MGDEDIATLSDADLAELRRAAHEDIERAYWAFTRCARSKPPVLVVPEAYRVRAACDREMRRRIRQQRGGDSG